MLRIKAALLALLCVNAAYFALATNASKAIDALAWLTLLLLFEAEASFRRHFEAPLRQRVLRIVRLFAAAGVIAAMLGYVIEGNTLDATNSVLWIAVVILLEAQIRWRSAADRYRLAFTLTAGLLYTGLGVLVLLWATEQMWFDAYDALLWLVAFVALELTVRHSEAGPTPLPG